MQLTECALHLPIYSPFVTSKSYRYHHADERYVCLESILALKNFLTIDMNAYENERESKLRYVMSPITPISPRQTLIRSPVLVGMDV